MNKITWHVQHVWPNRAPQKADTAKPDILLDVQKFTYM